MTLTPPAALLEAAEYDDLTLADRIAIHCAYDGFQNAIIDRLAHDAGRSRAVILAVLDTPIAELQAASGGLH